MTPETRKETLGVLLITFGIFVALSIISYTGEEIPQQLGIGYVDNFMGIAGLFIAHFLVRGTVGYFSLSFPVLIALSGWRQVNEKKLKKLPRWTTFTLLYVLLGAIFIGMVSQNNPEFGSLWAGKWGLTIARYSFLLLKTGGAVLFYFAALLIVTLLATGKSLNQIVITIQVFVEAVWKRLKSQLEQRAREREQKKTIPPPKPPKVEVPPPEAEPKRPEIDIPRRPVTPPPRTTAPVMPPVEMGSTEPTEETIMLTGPVPRDVKIKDGPYQFPTSDLLDLVPEQDYELSWDELDGQGRILEDALADFGIEGKVVKINPGPVITRFEVEPSPGIKVSKFTSLADDLARVMRAQRIRIVAPIPGKASIGIEIPNPTPQVVYFSEVVNAPQFQELQSPLSIVLGKTIDGHIYTTDLGRMPHLLIAGSTGSGKSVCINSIISSILFKAHPTEVQLVMIDPKRLELAPYRELRKHHLLFRPDLDEEVVTNSANAISILKSMVLEMERRYELLAEAGVRNIEDFNIKVKGGKFTPPPELGELIGPLPYIVLIIDELADLMLTAAKEVEEPIARLTQMSRAVGIHLIVATQRPSVDVITGVIKANFPCRIGFYVASKTDSRTILDMNGAEKLLGRGDMLFLPPGMPEPVRLHGAYLSTEEVERIVVHIARQPRFPKMALPVEEDDQADIPGFDSNYQRDKLFNEAAKIVVLTGQGSVSILQRRLKVGYARAARLIDELEMAGIVGPFDGSKAREVLVGEQELMDMGIFQSKNESFE